MKKPFTNIRNRYAGYWRAALLVLGGLLPVAGHAAGSALVISQVYGGGNGASSTYKNDFIELFNNSGSAFVVPAAGISVQYASGTGSSWSTTSIPGGTIIPAYSYYLIQEAGGTNGLAALPTPDRTGAINMGSAAGKVALVNSTTALTGPQTNPTGNAAILDFVGYGSNGSSVTVDAYEGVNPAPIPSVVFSVARDGSGTIDTDQNGVDFQFEVANPRNSASPTVVTTSVTGPVPTMATAGGNVLREGIPPFTERGLLYSTVQSPRLSTAGVGKVVDGAASTGTYSAVLGGLTPNTNYFIVAYTTNANGTSYGSDVQFRTATNITYYAKPTGSLEVLSTFGTNGDGSGDSPASFSAAGQTYSVTGTGRTLTANWTVSGADSKVVLQSGASLLVPAAYNFTGPLDLSANAAVVVANAAPGITFGSVDAASTIEYAQAGTYSVPVLGGAGYGNLTLRNGTKLLSAGTTTVRGNVLVSNVGGGSNVFGGAPNAASTLALGGNLTLAGTVSFSASATDRIVLVATNTATPQVLNGGGNTLRLYSLALNAGQAGVSLASNATNLELGNTAGGGYNLASGTVLTLNANTLAFAAGGKATFGGTGALAVDATSSLILDKNNASSFSGTAGVATLQLTPGSTQINNLTVNAVGSGSVASNTVALPYDLTVNGTLSIPSGTLTIPSGRTLTLNGPLDVDNGSFNGNDASLVVGGAGGGGRISFRGGSNNMLRNFTMARPHETVYLDGTITVSNDFLVSDGVLGLINALNINGTANTTGLGLIQSSVSSSLNVNGSGPIGTLTFADNNGFLNNLLLNRAGQTLNVEGQTLNVRNLTLTTGTLHLGTNLALNVTGPLVVADPAVARFGVTTSSAISFTGGSATVSGDIGPLAFVPGQDVMASLTLARNNSVTPVPLAQLTTNLSVRVLTFTRGNIFVQGNNRLSVLPGGAAVGGGINSYTNTLTLASVTNANPIFATLAYPLGVNGYYRPLTFTVTDAVTGTTSYTARQIEGPSPQRTLPPTLQRVSGLRYYSVVAEPGGSSTLGSATIKLSYDLVEDQITPGNTGLLRIAMADPADNSKWKDIGGNGTGANITSVSFAAGPLGDFTLATDGSTPTNVNPLPVELSAFAAQRQASKAVSVRWTTASEKNSDRFEVQRSLNGRDFVTIATAKAQGTSSQATAYAALDQTAPAAELYYRLRQVDLDGTVAFSPVLRVNGVGTAVELTLYPNPATDRLTATAPALAARTFRVLNTLGQVLATGPADAENPTVDVQALPTGTYLLELSSPAGRQVRRFVKTN
ncbi:T9SS type A sorting domain-containing protein [Hymenobacter daeguensis]